MSFKRGSQELRNYISEKTKDAMASMSLEEKKGMSEKISFALKGRKKSNAHRLKIKESNVKTWASPEIRKRHKNILANSIKYKLSVRNPIRIEKLRIAAKGQIHTKEMKDSQSVSMKMRWSEPEFKNKMLYTLSKRKKFIDTNIELEVGNILNEMKINYKHPFVVKGITNTDFWLTDYNTAVFCDGDYWHNRPDKKLIDARVNNELEEKKIKYLRFWEHDILNDRNLIKTEIFKAITC